MLVADLSTVEALYLVKWVLGGLLLVGVLLVLAAAALDVRERRRWRAMVPDAWPPLGELHDEVHTSSRKGVSS